MTLCGCVEMIILFRLKPEGGPGGGGSEHQKGHVGGEGKRGVLESVPYISNMPCTYSVRKKQS